jgi:diaminopimelate decarboxylase
MDHFLYRDGILHAEDVAIPEIAADCRHPLLRLLGGHADAPLPAVRGGAVLGTAPRLLRGEGEFESGCDPAHGVARRGHGRGFGGEYLRAKAAGVPGDRIVFSGVGKTSRPRCALHSKVVSGSSTSRASLSWSACRGWRRNWARLRRSRSGSIPMWTPGHTRRSPQGATTTSSGFRFPARVRFIALAARLPGHRGRWASTSTSAVNSRISSLSRQRICKVAELTRMPCGRMATTYGGSTSAAASGFPTKDRTRRHRCLWSTARWSGEPSATSAARSRSSRAGSFPAMPGFSYLRSSIVKHGEGRDFLILDAAMNDLVRPAMYGAWHDVVPVVRARSGEASFILSTSLDRFARRATRFARNRPMPAVGDGDLVAFRSAGAYGAVMASEYNTRPLIPEVLVKDDHFAVIRRGHFDEIIGRDTIPSWL